MMIQRLLPLVLMASLLVLSGCGAGKTEARYPTGADRAATGGDIYAEEPSIFGKGGVGGVFGSSRSSDSKGETGVAVNSYLWRASLDTVSFMPLASADPFGGVILTDWYSSPGKDNERFKLNVFILDRKLRADGVRVKVFRQMRSNGGWRDSDAAPETARQLEDAILTRARQLRIADQQKED